LRVDPFKIIPFLLAFQALLGWVATGDVGEPRRVYVFLPFFGTLPGPGGPSPDEAEKVAARLPFAIRPSEVGRGVAMLGSTLSLDDLTTGIEHLDQLGHPLSKRQSLRVTEILSSIETEREELQRLQVRLLDLERQASSEMSRTVALLPPASRDRVSGGQAPARSPSRAP
jgi:hypothetical protein